MKMQLEQTDIETIATRVMELLKPLISNARKGEQHDTIFDVQSLAKHLGVDPSWVYKQVSMKAIPFFKVGKYTRFQKKEIDRWIEARILRPTK